MNKRFGDTLLSSSTPAHDFSVILSGKSICLILVAEPVPTDRPPPPMKILDFQPHQIWRCYNYWRPRPLHSWEALYRSQFSVQHN